MNIVPNEILLGEWEWDYCNMWGCARLIDEMMKAVYIRCWCSGAETVSLGGFESVRGRVPELTKPKRAQWGVNSHHHEHARPLSRSATHLTTAHK